MLRDKEKGKPDNQENEEQKTPAFELMRTYTLSTDAIAASRQRYRVQQQYRQRWDGTQNSSVSRQQVVILRKPIGDQTRDNPQTEEKNTVRKNTPATPWLARDVPQLILALERFDAKEASDFHSAIELLHNNLIFIK